MGKDNRNKHKQRGGRRNFQTNIRKGQGNKGNSGDQDRRRPNFKREFGMKVSLREDQVGITEYASKTAGFTGIIKSRFSDFHVNEINKAGQVLQLNDLKIPQLVEESLTEEEVTATCEELGTVVTAGQWEKIAHLAKAKDGEPIVMDVTFLDKEKRTQIHKVLKKLYPGQLVSATESVESTDETEKKLIKIMKPSASKDRNRAKWTFAGEYVHFLMHKENMDTSEVAVTMADRMNLRPSQVHYCGTKDKRAKTTQLFCIKHRTPLQIVNSIKRLPAVHVGNFEFSKEVVKLGDLKGNRFRIALRHVSGEQQDIELGLEALRTTGFINYYGLQRFGNCASVPTYEVGVALLKSDYKTACELILKPRDNDLHFMRAIRELWWKDRNSAAAAAQFRNDNFIEKKLLDGLAQYGESDYASALRKIPRNMLLLYPHAFQSLIYNRIVSRRIREFGLTLMVGDLVYRNSDELDLDTTIELVPEVDDDDESVEQEVKEPAKQEESPGVIKEESIFKRKVKPLTENDIATGNYTLFDVVLPLPGYDVTYPSNVVTQWYEELLGEYVLTSEALRHKVKTYALAGAYRKILLQPSEMSWSFHFYDSSEASLIASDWELLKGKDLPVVAENGKFKALVLDFCLPTSAYATMLLRELLKADTSTKNQINLEHSVLQKDSDPAIMKEEPAVTTEKRKIAEVGEGENDEQEKEDNAKQAKLSQEPAVVN